MLPTVERHKYLKVLVVSCNAVSIRLDPCSVSIQVESLLYTMSSFFTLFTHTTNEKCKILVWLLRGHVNKNKIKKKTLEVGGWVKCPIGNKKNWKTYLYTLFYYVFGRAFERR